MDAYLGLADAYEAQGDTEQARQVLENVLSVVANPNIAQSRLDGLEASAAPEFTPGPTIDPTRKPDPTPGPTPETTAKPKQEPTAGPTPEPTPTPTSEPTSESMPTPTPAPAQGVYILDSGTYGSNLLLRQLNNLDFT